MKHKDLAKLDLWVRLLIRRKARTNTTYARDQWLSVLRKRHHYSPCHEDVRKKIPERPVRLRRAEVAPPVARGNPGRLAHLQPHQGDSLSRLGVPGRPRASSPRRNLAGKCAQLGPGAVRMRVIQGPCAVRSRESLIRSAACLGSVEGVGGGVPGLRRLEACVAPHVGEEKKF